MNIINDKHYLNLYSDMKDAGFTTQTITKICFESDIGKEAIQEIKDYLEERYKMYQYKKDNGVKYGEHDLFYWTGEGLYFDVSLNDKESYSVEYNEKIVNEIIQYIEQHYADNHGSVYLHWLERTDWKRINDYITNTEFDINNLPYEKLRVISSNLIYTSSQISEEATKKLYVLHDQLCENLKDKKVVFYASSEGIFGKTEQIIQGTLREIKDNGFGVFKPRATRTYYPIGIRNMFSVTAAN